MAKLVIDFNERTGAVSVNGPLENKMLCYGLLECARDAINDHTDKREKSDIVIPTLQIRGKQ